MLSPPYRWRVEPDRAFLNWNYGTVAHVQRASPTAATVAPCTPGHHSLLPWMAAASIAGSDVSQDQPFDAFARLGQQLVQPEELA